MGHQRHHLQNPDSARPHALLKSNPRFTQSEFLDNPNKYSVVRVLPSWSRSLSIIGLTVSSHDGIFKSSQNNIKKKTF